MIFNACLIGLIYYILIHKYKMSKGAAKDAQTADVESILNLRRAYTTGTKLGARKMFIFNEDGTIAGL